MAGGRPTKFLNTLADTICKLIAEGKSLRSIVKDENMPSASTIFRWLLDDKHKEFWEQYEKARNVQAEMMFEELLEIADNDEHDELEKEREDGSSYYVPNSEFIQRSRLRVDVRKWYLSKVLPKKFGDKMDLTTDGKPLIISFDNSFATASKTAGGRQK